MGCDMKKRRSMNSVQLNQYNNDDYTPGSTLKKTLWYFANMFFFKTLLPFPSSFKVKLLKLFGAKVGNGVVMKPGVTCKSHSVLAVGSVATKNLDAYSVYQGNTALKKRERMIK